MSTNSVPDEDQNGLTPETIVLSGMAGRFPNADDVYQFRHNLFNKIDMVSDDERRWPATHAEIPQRTGKVNFAEKFDAGFFGVHQRQANTMDPMCRMLLERSIEALLDAGINPKEVHGTDTGVFIGACFSESEKTSFYESLDPEKYGVTGCTRSMLAKRISYSLQLQGKSFITDTACSSSLFALEHAYRAIKEGNCNMAIVGGCNLCLHPVVSLQFARLGVLSLDGACKSFDNAANGYARSEAVSVVILQKAKDARRVYAEIIHSKTNCDGYKEQGITYPSGKVQKVLLEEFYDECEVDPSTLSYVEAHGTGTKVGDPEELGTLDEIFCKNRKDPLLIGSVKSNIGHNEPISGLCSVVKVALAFEEGKIPPNIHYNTPREGVEALETGRMKVVSEVTPLPEGDATIGINSFGFGGANSHLLLRWNQKQKQQVADVLPRLVCLSGRTLEGLQCLMHQLQSGFDHELIGLVQKAYQETIPGHVYRGYLVMTQQGTIAQSTFKHVADIKPLKLVFGHLDEYLHFGRHLFNVPIFAEHVKKIQGYLKAKSLTEPSFENNHLGAFILHSGISQVLKMLHVEADQVFGLDFAGKLTAEYFKSNLTLEQCLDQLLSKTLNKTLLRNNTEVETTVEYTELIIGSSNNQNSSLKLLDPKVDSLLSLLQGLGHLYEIGYDLTLENLYPKVKWPVGRGTSMISPFIKWDHSKNWFVTVYKAEDKTKSGQRVIEVTLRDDEWHFLKGHVIDGRCLFPATGYLVLIWETLARVVGKLTSDMKIVFEDVKFLRACTVPMKGHLELILNIKKGSGHFEIVEGGSAGSIVTGRIYEYQDIANEWTSLPTPEETNSELEYLVEKDIYKEMRLRGYNYKGEFRRLKMCNLDTTMGKITWAGNWIPFMDCMLQMQIMSEDTRNLYVPTRISKILIDSSKHITTSKSYVVNPEEQPQVPIYFYRDLNILRCGGIEIRGLWATSIPRRSQADPVLENYKFSPYASNLHKSYEEIIRLFIQIALENEPVITLKSVEILDDKPLISDDEEFVCMSQCVKTALSDQPVVKSQLIVLTNKEIDAGTGITVEDKKVNTEFDCYLVIGQNLSLSLEKCRSLINIVKPEGFVISIEDVTNEPVELEGLFVLASYTNENYNFLLLKPKGKVQGPSSKKYEVIEVAEVTEMAWFGQLQAALKTEDHVILWSNDAKSGILGLTNCLLREPNISKRVSLFWLPENIKFRLEDQKIKEQLTKNLSINILRNDEWGSYRHFKQSLSAGITEVEHCFVNVTTRGDLSSLRWIQGPLTHDSNLHPEMKIVHVYYSAINFRDIMTATGRIQTDVVTRNRLEQDCVQGFEFAGRTANGIRVMGMMTRNAMATLVPADVNLMWEVPKHWSMKDAVTVPAVYGTVLYGLINRAGLQRGERILIHSATGGVGHAALAVAKHFECEIFVTVGTEEKREYIRQNFPQIKENHIGNSRDLSFLQMVLKETNNEGVDLVLNSLADEKLQASVKCLRRGGRFIEIGKYDLAGDSRLSLDLMEKEAVYHGVMLDALFEADPAVKRAISCLIQDGINKNYIKALPTNLFQSDQLEEAFRFMGTGKHIGKVVIEIRPEETEQVIKPVVQTFKAIARFYCSPEKIYIINGGLGGFGLELIDWLVLRDARNVVINSRRGISSAYQKIRIQLWQSYGTEVRIFTEDLSTLEGCESLIKSSKGEENKQIAAVFNLAVILKDALFENQTKEDFKTVIDPKGTATENLDIVTRHLCPKLEHFVIFSSVSCGRGNAGQTNYGLANSIMERICEQRHLQGLPALAIQWGAIGDVGLVANMQEEHTDLVIGGTLQQKINSCLEALDGFLRQNEPIVGSMVVAEKKTGSSGANNIVDAVVNILGIRDLKTVSHHSTFPELGMDSMMAVEIKQTLEREYDVFLSPQDIRSMTFSRLQEIAQQKNSDKKEGGEDLPKGVKVLLRFIANEGEGDIPLVEIVQGPGLNEYDTEMVKLFLLPGIEGMATLFDPMKEHLSVPTICCQFGYLEDQEDSILEMAKSQVERIKELINAEFCIAAHSFGSAVALEIAAQLEKLGLKGTLILIDGAPSFMKDLIRNQLMVSTEAEFQTSLLCALMSVYLPFEVIIKYKGQMLQCDTYDQRVETALGVAPKELPHRPEYMKKVFNATFKRMKAIYSYEPSFGTLQSKVYLFRPSTTSVLEVDQDYGLSQIVGHDVEVRFYEGNHVSILENIDLIQDIDNIAQKCGNLRKDDEERVEIQEIGMKPGLITIPENLIPEQTLS